MSLINKLNKISIRRYLKASEGDLNYLIGDNEKHTQLELLNCWRELQIDRINSFGLSQSSKSDLEDLLEMSKCICEMFEDGKDYPDTRYYILQNKKKNDNFDGDDIIEGELIGNIFEATNKLLDPEADTAYSMFTLLNVINNKAKNGRN